jgi:hypothetical protein
MFALLQSCSREKIEETHSFFLSSYLGSTLPTSADTSTMSPTLFLFSLFFLQSRCMFSFCSLFLFRLLPLNLPRPPLFPSRSSDLSFNPVGSRHLNSFRRRHSSPPQRIAEVYGTCRRYIILPIHLFPPMELHCKDTIPKI